MGVFVKWCEKKFFDGFCEKCVCQPYSFISTRQLAVANAFHSQMVSKAAEYLRAEAPKISSNLG